MMRSSVQIESNSSSSASIGEIFELLDGDVVTEVRQVERQLHVGHVSFPSVSDPSPHDPACRASPRSPLSILGTVRRCVEQRDLNSSSTAHDQNLPSAADRSGEHRIPSGRGRATPRRRTPSPGRRRRRGRSHGRDVGARGRRLRRSKRWSDGCPCDRSDRVVAAVAGRARPVAPGIGGLDILVEYANAKQRNGGYRLPIIVLSGRDGETDRIVGLDLGADDYLVKPFSPGELAARARSVLRRCGDYAGRRVGSRSLPGCRRRDRRASRATSG